MEKKEKEQKKTTRSKKRSTEKAQHMQRQDMERQDMERHEMQKRLLEIQYSSYFDQMNQKCKRLIEFVSKCDSDTRLSLSLASAAYQEICTLNAILQQIKCDLKRFY